MLELVLHGLQLLVSKHELLRGHRAVEKFTHLAHLGDRLRDMGGSLRTADVALEAMHVLGLLQAEILHDLLSQERGLQAVDDQIGALARQDLPIEDNANARLVPNILILILGRADQEVVKHKGMVIDVVLALRGIGRLNGSQDQFKILGRPNSHQNVLRVDEWD